MIASDRSRRNRWSEFIGNLGMQFSAAFAVGLPVDDAYASVEPGAHPVGSIGPGVGWSADGDSAGRYRDDAAGYMTRNGLGSLEVGAFRDRTGE